MHPTRWGDPAAAAPLPEPTRALVELAFGVTDSPAATDVSLPAPALDESVLAEILASRHVVKAGVSVADDLKALKKSFAFHEQAVVDLGSVAKRHGLKQSGVRNLAGLFLGFRIPKGAKTTNWASRRLSPQQVAYAATDAWACRELYVRFEELGLLEENRGQVQIS